MRSWSCMHRDLQSPLDAFCLFRLQAVRLTKQPETRDKNKNYFHNHYYYEFYYLSSRLLGVLLCIIIIISSAIIYHYDNRLQHLHIRAIPLYDHLTTTATQRQYNTWVQNHLDNSSTSAPAPEPSSVSPSSPASSSECSRSFLCDEHRLQPWWVRRWPTVIVLVLMHVDAYFCHTTAHMCVRGCVFLMSRWVGKLTGCDLAPLVLGPDEGSASDCGEWLKVGC